MLIVGLGNPGKKYETTPHNAGFLAIDALMEKLAPEETLSETSKLSSKITSIHVGGEKVILAKPTTFMNESGQAVRALMDYYKIPINEIVILHDEADISLGKYKEAFDRGAAGHNGIKSIIQHLGTKEFKRIRIGIKPENEYREFPLLTYVLKPLKDEELDILNKSIQEIIENIG